MKDELAGVSKSGGQDSSHTQPVAPSHSKDIGDNDLDPKTEWEDDFDSDEDDGNGEGMGKGDEGAQDELEDDIFIVDEDIDITAPILKEIIAAGGAVLAETTFDIASTTDVALDDGAMVEEMLGQW